MCGGLSGFGGNGGWRLEGRIRDMTGWYFMMKGWDWVMISDPDSFACRLCRPKMVVRGMSALCLQPLLLQSCVLQFGPTGDLEMIGFFKLRGFVRS